MNDVAPTLDTPVVHPTYVKLLCMALRNQGLDANAVLVAAGLGSWKAFAVSDALIDHRTTNRVIAQALAVSGRPWLGLEFGATVQVSAHGPLGYAAVSSHDLRQALQTVARHVPVRNAALRLHLRETRQGAVLELTLRLDMEAAHDFMVTLVFAAILRLMEAVAGPSLDSVVVDLPMVEPAWSAQIRHLFKGRIRFGASRLAFHLDRELLERPCMTADPAAFEQASKECEKLQSKTATTTMAQRVRQLLVGREGHYPTLGAAAGFFSVSPRTLIRRLKEEGTSFQDMLDEARKQRAMWYLTQTQLTVEDIAARLGYVDTTNFSRTFRRWHGVVPSEVRKKAAPGTV